ncbi:hypothetical protein RB195_007979 [Necator americanus]|uniref:Uncharacterized protein n=1 Tax=Necator americanus TaxID=51031 RepID=A0ABR1BZY0_NECAM
MYSGEINALKDEGSCIVCPIGRAFADGQNYDLPIRIRTPIKRSIYKRNFLNKVTSVCFLIVIFEEPIVEFRIYPEFDLKYIRAEGIGPGAANEGLLFYGAH